MLWKAGKLATQLTFLTLLSVDVAVQQKCTASDTRQVYHSCDLQYDNMALWCDLTNFTTIPNPNNVQAYAPCALANALYMNNSCLEEIEADQMRRYTRLERIDCSDNLLTKLRNGTFSSADKLRHMDLSLNRIHELEDNFLEGLFSLQFLRMSNNSISRLPKDIFRNAPSLKEVHLDCNRLKEIHLEVFSNLTHLKILNFSYNMIYRWIPDRKAFFPKLLVLDLSNNHLLSLKRNDFSSIPSLQWLDLRGNRIGQTDEGTLETNSKLAYIDLRENRLQILPRNLFSELCELRVLLLNGNHLHTPNIEWFVNVVRNGPEDVDSVTSFVSENNWRCDCASTVYQDLLLYLSAIGKASLHDKLNLLCQNQNYLNSVDLSLCPESYEINITMILQRPGKLCQEKPKPSRFMSYHVDIHKIEQNTQQDEYVTVTVSMVLLGIFVAVGLAGAVAFFVHNRRRSRKKTPSPDAETNRDDAVEAKPCSKDTVNV